MTIANNGCWRAAIARVATAVAAASRYLDQPLLVELLRRENKERALLSLWLQIDGRQLLLPFQGVEDGLHGGGCRCPRHVIACGLRQLIHICIDGYRGRPSAPSASDSPGITADSQRRLSEQTRMTKDKTQRTDGQKIVTGRVTETQRTKRSCPSL
jgi:hypothetical protein